MSPAHPLRAAACALTQLFASFGICAVASAQSLQPRATNPLPAAPSALPFAAGERLVYDAHAGPGLNGRAEMWVEGPTDVRGTPTFVLNFAFETKVGFLRVTDRTTSWLDPVRMASLRFTKEERRLLARHSEDVSMDQAGRGWKDANGSSGVSATDAPLDELSFIYVVRSLSFATDSMIVLNRHFDTERNPTTVRLTGRGVVRTPAGTFDTQEVEMRVRDARNYHGEGVIRFSLSDDPCRRPVRIVSSIPGAGTVVMALTSALPVVEGCGPRAEATAGH